MDPTERFQKANDLQNQPSLSRSLFRFTTICIVPPERIVASTLLRGASSGESDMFRLRSTHPARWLAIATLAAATALSIGYVALAADSDAVLKFKPGKHDFGQVVATKVSAPLTVTVTNKSSGAVTFTSIVVTETFSIQSDKCSGAPLAPGSSCNVEVVFHPLVTGKVSDKQALTFTDSAANSPQQVELEGQGIFGSFI